MTGTLFVVGTPIGNLEDLTFRALRTLREVDLIAAEDTRRTAKLLAHYEVQKPLVSLHEHNETRETPRLVARLRAGDRIALVSDAGTPGIADPGATLVRAARDAGITIVPIPGASAVATALSVSGFPADTFTFLGFPPASGARRVAWFKTLSDESRTVVFFEAPHRVARTISELAYISVTRPIIVCREMTKVHEELVIYKNMAVKERGEFVVVVSSPPQGLEPVSIDAQSILRLFGVMTNEARPSREEAIAAIALALGVDILVVKKIVKNNANFVK